MPRRALANFSEKEQNEYFDLISKDSSIDIFCKKCNKFYFKSDCELINHKLCCPECRNLVDIN